MASQAAVTKGLIAEITSVQTTVNPREEHWPTQTEFI